MDAKEAVFWSSYSAVATPNIQEEIFVQRSAPGRAWFTKTDSTALPPITRKQWLIIVLIFFGNFCAAMSFSLQAPFFPKQATEKGATPTEYGLIFSSFYFTIFLIAPVYGKLVAIVRPNLMLNGGFSLTCLCVVLFGFINLAPAGKTFVALAFLIRILEGLGAAAYITASATIIMSEFPGRIGTVLSSLKTAFSVGVIIGPTIGGFLYDIGGYTTPFVVCGSIGFVCNLVTYLVIPSIEDKHDSTPTDLRKFWSGPLIYMYAVAIFGSYVCVGFNQATLEPHLRSFNLSTTILGLVFMIPGICNGLMTPVWGWLCDKKVNTKLLTSIGAFFTLLYLLLVGPAPFFPFGTKLWLVLLSMAFFGIGIGGASICAFMATLEYTLSRGFERSISTNGLVSSMFTLCQSVGSFTGPALGGVLLQHIGYAWGTVVLFSFEAIVAVLVTTVYIREVCCSGAPIGRSTPHRRLLDGDTAANSASCEFTTVSDQVQRSQQQQRQCQYGACNGAGPARLNA
ncbi:MFS-type transporter SLC18B1-like [Dermacentor andersoni]|uniref:MFS-type transporter SLC18B1-like n=1 Tax=Dermacentor andersoni TaxID=34620 RepID=UPI0021553E5E|nr:MFS-type transporter SLC18B1-like [Dermacentor andersoni]